MGLSQLDEAGVPSCSASAPSELGAVGSLGEENRENQDPPLELQRVRCHLIAYFDINGESQPLSRTLNFKALSIPWSDDQVK